MLNLTDKYLVDIDMPTYNHENYISQAIESVLAQKANFKFRLIVGEDCSTDNTRAIVEQYSKSYPEIVFPIYHSKNVGAAENGRIILSRCTSKYLAILEGDDFWIDPNKLQKQIDFLEANPSYGLVHTAANVVDKNGKLIAICNENKPEGDVFYSLLFESSFIITNTVCARTDISKNLIDRIKNENLWFVMDYWYWLCYAMLSKIHYIPEITSAYRSHNFGITKATNTFFNYRIPLIIFDITSQKLKTEKSQKVSFRNKWRLFTIFNRALLSTHVKIDIKRKYIILLYKNPFYILAIFPAVFKKIFLWIKNRVRLKEKSPTIIKHFG